MLRNLHLTFPLGPGITRSTQLKQMTPQDSIEDQVVPVGDHAPKDQMTDANETWKQLSFLMSRSGTRLMHS